MARKITIRGHIGWDEQATPEYLEAELAAAGTEEVLLEINSPGGSVFAGLEMANQIRHHPHKVTARVVGLAASMASYLLMMATSVEVEDNAVLMVHNPFGGIFGADYRDAEKFAALMKSLQILLARAYAAKTGLSVDAAAEVMDNDTYLFGQEIVDAGFADSVVGGGGDEGASDKATALGSAQIEIAACVEKVRASEATRQQSEKIAALLCADGLGPTAEQSGHGKDPSAEKTEKIMEAQTVDFDKFLAENPAAKADYKRSLEAAEKKGSDAAAERFAAAVDGAMPYLTSSAYAEPVRARMIENLKAADVKSIKDMAAMADQMLEAAKGSAATEESGPETKPEGGITVDSPNGVVTEPSQISGAVASMRAASGQGGK